VHKINEDSPFYNLSKIDIDNAFTEVLVFIEAFDESFSNTVVARTSYLFNEIKYGYTFVPIYKPTTDNKQTILYLNKLNDVEEAAIKQPLQ
jgi:inward rectifier potassium channel